MYNQISYVFIGNLKSVGDYYVCTNIKRNNWNGKYCSFSTTDPSLLPQLLAFFGFLAKQPIPFKVSHPILNKTC